MFIAESISTITRQRIFIIRSSVPAVEPCLIPILGVAVMFGMRKIDFFPFLNRRPAKFSIGAVGKFIMAVQMEEVSKKFNSRFFLQINFTEHLETANVGHRVRSNVLRMELEVGKYITEKFRSGRAKPLVQMLHKHNYFSILRFRRIFSPKYSPMDDLFLC